MLPPYFIVRIVSLGLAGLGAGGVYAQDFPNKPLRIYTAVAGGGSDATARQIAQGISGFLGQSVVVDNRAEILAAEAVSKAPPDGYTLLLASGSFWTAPLLQKTPYDPVRDFSPITLVVTQPSILVVHPSVPVKSVKELIALAKARPGELNYASSGTGTPSHLGGELFKSMAGINIVRINYKGAGAAFIDLIGGQVQLMFPTAAGVAPHLKSRRLNALAVTSAKPSALLPELPTVAASGLAGYESVAAQGMWAPAKTPVVIINRLNQEVLRFLNTAEARERFLSSGVEPVGSSPEEFSAAIKSDMARLSKTIKDAGIKVD